MNHQKYKITWALLSATMALTISLLLGIELLTQSVRSSHKNWVDYSEKSVAILEQIQKLDRAIGYGGFIHNFKNYILRREDPYLEAADANLTSAYGALIALEALLPGPETSAALVTIEATIKRYENSLDYARHAPFDQTSQALDAAVRIEDGPALKAIKVLTDHVSGLAEDQKKEGLQANGETVRTLKLGYLIALSVMAGGAVLLWFSRTIERSNFGKLVSARQVDALFNDSPDALFLVNGAGVIKRANQGALSLFGYKRADELVGHKVEKLVKPEVSKAHIEHRTDYMAHPVRRKMNEEGVLFGVHKDGSSVPLDIALNQMPSEKGHLVLVACRDMTDALQATNDLKQALDRAQQHGEAKTRFLATMSHELRTPLNAVIGFSETILYTEKNLNERTKERVNYIHAAGNHLLAMVNDILDFSRNDQGQIKLDCAPLSIRHLMEDVRHLFDDSAHSKGLDFEVAIDSDMPEWVCADEVRIRQILINLVSNAIKFTSEGHVSLKASAASAAKPDKTRPPHKLQLTFRIKDTGIGIAPESLQTIFTPFTQADDTIARRFEGTGLGLAISKRLCRLMEGDIQTISTEGQGSEFIVTLMVKPITPEELEAAKAKADPVT